jgi:uncharacterized protein
MVSSIFNLRVPLPGDDVFVMNTLTDAQVIVSADVASLLDRSVDPDGLDAEDRDAFETLVEHGFITPGRHRDRLALVDHLDRLTGDTSALHVTILTTMQCNFACDYCFQGDHGDNNKFADKMSMQTAERVVGWIARELDRVKPERLSIMFFGGEPLLNLPVMYFLAERLWVESARRQVAQSMGIITNGLLLTEEVVERMLAFGLRGAKITLDGDRETHDRMRPLRGGQGTFDRIVANLKRLNGRIPISIGGNFDEHSVESIPVLLDFLKAQEFGPSLHRVNFKPVIRFNGGDRVQTVTGRTVFALTPVNERGLPLKPLGGTCMTAAGEGLSSGCGGHDIDDQMAQLLEQTRAAGFKTADGIHNGPCHVHVKHAHTIGPDGSLYACPGFTGEKGMSTGHIDDRRDSSREEVRGRFDRLSPWDACGDCAFIPVCAGGCVAASHATLGDMNTPACHKRAYESAVASLAHRVASAPEELSQ